MMRILLLVLMPDLASAEPARLVVTAERLAPLDDRVFGSFMERLSWGGEFGIESALRPGTRELQEGVEARLAAMKIPLMRFPGGTDVDYINWTDMIDHAPGRKNPARPITKGNRGDRVSNEFGYDEFLRLCERLDIQPLLVFNLGDALRGLRTPEEAAEHALDLLHYSRATQGSWAELRARNGHPEPYNVTHVQFGNEIFLIIKREHINPPQGVSNDDWYMQCLMVYLRAFRAAYPDLVILADAISDEIADRSAKLEDDRLDALVGHHYQPWRITGTTRGEEEFALKDLSEEEIWKAWVTTPGIDPATGQAHLELRAIEQARRHGMKAAVTEWNWNGFGWDEPSLIDSLLAWWGVERDERPAFDSDLAKGLGAAGYLHGLMRQADTLMLATQSITVGNRWDINAIRVDPTGAPPPHFYPSGQVTGLYSKWHGDYILKSELTDVAFYEQPYSMGLIDAQKRVAYLDVVVSASERALYLHVINRHFDEDQRLAIDLSAHLPLRSIATLHGLSGRLHDDADPGELLEVAAVTTSSLMFNDARLDVRFPARSVSVLVIEREETHVRLGSPPD